MKRRIAMAAVCSVWLSGCSTVGGGNLLDNPQFSAVPERASLATPPEDAVQPVTAVTANEIEEENLGPQVPTVQQLDAVALPGIDATKTAVALEGDIAAHKVETDVRWRGKKSGDGIDIADANGTLCSGVRDQGVDPVRVKSTITLACSDGRVAELSTQSSNAPAQVRFGDKLELVDLSQ